MTHAATATADFCDTAPAVWGADLDLLAFEPPPPSRPFARAHTVALSVGRSAPATLGYIETARSLHPIAPPDASARAPRAQTPLAPGADAPTVIDALLFTSTRDSMEHTILDRVWGLHDESFKKPVISTAARNMAACFVRIGDQHFALFRPATAPHDELVMACMASPSFDAARALAARARVESPWP